MKKKSRVKLGLKRETLKNLVQPQMRQAIGGTGCETDDCCGNTWSCCYTDGYSDCVDFSLFVCW